MSICQWITAHSGCEGTDENSWEHIHAAKSSGADVIEIDVRLNRQTLYLSHNLPETVEKCLTLEQCFREVSASGMKINCDLKESNLEEWVLRLADQCGMRNRIILTGTVRPEFLADLPDWAMVSLNLECLLPEICGERIKGNPSLSFSEREKLLDKIRHFGVQSVNLNYRLLDSALLHDLCAEKIDISIWTINDSNLLQQYLQYPLQNITTRIPVEACIQRNRLLDKGIC
ncbi:MAG: glycerophosphodiester phosphodiesterase [Candidatus Merdivicinus sp.]|jgi:glycerophosphoryl diester phosphodiesterase